MNIRQYWTGINASNAVKLVAALLTTSILAVPSAQADVSQVPAQVPLFVNDSVPPLNMLVVGRDHKLFFPAYNDASDLDNDGSIEIRYKPSITYLGYFDSNTCYSYTGSYFTPAAVADSKKCTSKAGRWSGDYLNYLTTSRADALRKVLYGGYRSTDTATQTILERAYIPTDAHTWGKEYNGSAATADGYNLSDYTPFANPTGSNRALFANNTQTTAGGPLLRVVPSIANLRIYGWVSREVTQGGAKANDTSFKEVDLTSQIQDFIVRVEVCKKSTVIPLESNCKTYPNGNNKPTGILHDYGEGNQMYFGLMTGTYANNLQGGAIRKAISSFANEVDTSTGIFGTAKTSGNTTTYTKGALINTLDSLKIAKTACSTQGNSIDNGTCQDWGNPLAEMMFETMRYFSGVADTKQTQVAPTTAYLSGTGDSNLGLTGLTSWSNPYSASPNPEGTTPTFPSCSKPFETLFSDINPTYDSDLPGSAYTIVKGPTTTTALNDFDVATFGQKIWTNDVGSGAKNINIGQTPTSAGRSTAPIVASTYDDLAPTAKSASSFGNIRGLPEEPAKQGTFNAGAVAYFGNTYPITSLGSQKVQTFSIALSSTLPRIQMPVGTGTITLLPYGKVVNTNGVTEQITGFYIDSLYNMPGQQANTNINGGRAQAVFRVVFDDSGQGGDYDMDAIVLYTVSVVKTGTVDTLDVRLETVYAQAGYESHMGYTISGTTADGIYLEVTGGGNGNLHYALDTPGTQIPNSCSAGCSGSGTLLPGMKSGSTVVNGATFKTRNFTPSSSRSVTNLMDPLWYAAKWGGFGDSSNTTSSLPIAGQWDSNVSGTPDNYFLVSSASTLKAQLQTAFSQILQKNTSVAPPAASPPPLSSSTATTTYTDSFNVALWSGDLTKATESYDSTTGVKSATVNWSAAAAMPAAGSRNIKIANAAGTALVDFTYANLAGRSYPAGSAWQTTASSTPSTGLTADQVAFVRGDRSLEGSTFRRRLSTLGDIVNSQPVVVDSATFVTSMADTLSGATKYAAFQTTASNRRAQVYVGANDGMLHAFDVATGVEKFAFIPTALVSKLNVLTSKTYNSDSTLHRFFVDGTPVVSDVYFGSAWHTVLIGTLGGGGSEVFALDVTDPNNISLLWEFTSVTDPDLGNTFSTPYISKLHSGDWGVIFGNGYNSGNGGTASLFILNVATGAVIKKLNTSTTASLAAGANGLSTPVILDADSDGIADYVYAGDLQGNLWRFDLINPGSLTATATAANYAVSFAGKPLYTAAAPTAGAAAQSITTPPVVFPHPTGTGTLVIFGTGRYFTSADKSSTDLQSLYGIWDPLTQGQTASTPAGTTQLTSLGRANLQAQTLSTVAGTLGTSTGLRTVTTNAVDWASKYGWYLDLKTSATLTGERMVDLLDIQGSVLFVATRTPITGVCEAGIQGKRLGLDPNTGGATTFSIFDFSRNGVIGSEDTLSGAIVSGFDSAAGGFAVVAGNGPSGLSTMYNSDGTNSSMNVFTGFQYNGRQTWRVIP
ncbi:pilus assembly protein [Pseudomonas sp. LP_7_YM]|uniref:pilus assembly protein n=1 Tax=Pseudomonas sp. LP_7_YM TaxID=2485137 RepID=UPI0010622852|nr:PilC/PilY family type IV pilus protein [Pseudomonas sp. LP_7_YM]TDV65788.1 type IV pilus assembly protein PilY1 [Pseudomonas sp. LP_7_YM]